MASAPRNPSARKSARSLCLRISAYHEASSSGKYPTYTTASQNRPYIASRRTLMFNFSCDLPPSPPPGKDSLNLHLEFGTMG